MATTGTGREGITDEEEEYEQDELVGEETEDVRQIVGSSQSPSSSVM